MVRTELLLFYSGTMVVVAQCQWHTCMKDTVGWGRGWGMPLAFEWKDPPRKPGEQLHQNNDNHEDYHAPANVPAAAGVGRKTQAPASRSVSPCIFNRHDLRQKFSRSLQRYTGARRYCTAIGPCARLCYRCIFVAGRCLQTELHSALAC